MAKMDLTSFPIDSTWNPATGCTKISPECDNCFAELITKRYAGRSYPNGFDITLRPKKIWDPFSWKKPQNPLVSTMTDLFHAHIPDAYIAAVWSTMWWTSELVRNDGRPVHRYFVISKRPMRALRWLEKWQDQNQRVAMITEAYDQEWCNHEDIEQAAEMTEVLPNVSIGMSAGMQKYADIRIPLLLRMDVAARFVVAEPLLGPVDLSPWLDRIDQVVSGCETGAKARPMHPSWERSLNEQCTEFGVNFYSKNKLNWTLREELDERLQKPDDSASVRFVNPKTGDVLDHSQLGYVAMQRFRKQKSDS